MGAHPHAACRDLAQQRVESSAVTPLVNRVNPDEHAFDRGELCADGVEWDLINGRLVRPFAESLRLSKTYWIVCPKATSNVPKIVTFRDWLLAEASGELNQLKQLGKSKS